MSSFANVGIVAVGLLIATIILCAFWAIGFQAATFQGKTTPASAAAIESAANVAGLLFFSIVSALALFLERKFRRPTHAALTILRWMGLTVALGSICILLGLAAFEFGDRIAFDVSVDIAVDLLRKVAR